MTTEAAVAQPPQRERLTLTEAIADLGWFSWIFAIIVAGPSVLALSQAVFINHRLSDALQWIVDGYNGIADVLGSAVEPLIRPAIDWINAQFDWSLTLQPQWRPLFVLTMIFVAGVVRSNWRNDQKTLAIKLAIALTIGALAGSLAAGVAPENKSWWIQGLMGAAAPALVIFAAAIANKFDLESLSYPLIIGAMCFVLTALLSLAPALASTAAIASVGLVVMLAGVAILITGLVTGERHAGRMGLTVLGGFITAGMVLAADYALKM